MRVSANRSMRGSFPQLMTFPHFHLTPFAHAGQSGLDPGDISPAHEHSTARCNPAPERHPPSPGRQTCATTWLKRTCPARLRRKGFERVYRRAGAIAKLRNSQPMERTPEPTLARSFLSANKNPPQAFACGGFDSGGRGRNRTGVHGFAIRCMTTLPPGLK